MLKIVLTIFLFFAQVNFSSAQEIDQLIRFLKHDEPSIRSRSAKALGEIRSEKAIQPLIIALDDNAYIVRRNVAFALGLIGESASPAVPKLIELLKDPNWSVRVNSAFALGAIGESSAPAIPFLINALDDPNWEVSVNAIKALGQIGPASVIAVPALSSALKSENALIRINAATALSEIGEVGIPSLIEAFKSENDVVVRRTIAFAFGRMGRSAKIVIPILKEKLNDPELSVRVAVAGAISLIQTEERDKMIPILISGLRSDDNPTQLLSKYYLKRIEQLMIFEIVSKLLNFQL